MWIGYTQVCLYQYYVYNTDDYVIVMDILTFIGMLITHCYGYTNIYWHADYNNMIDWSQKRYVCDSVMYITTHVHEIVTLIPTSRFLKLYHTTGLQFDKEHSPGFVWGRQILSNRDEVWKWE